MDNLAIVNDNIDETFIIDDDSKAEWAILKINAEKAELARMELVCNNMISQYKMRIEKAQNEYQSKTLYYRTQLLNYFNTIKPNETKTQQTYKLPSGTLKRKFGGIEYIRDDERLLRFIENEENYKPYVKISKSVDWASLKKSLIVKGDEVVDQITGEIVPGITIQQKEDRFIIED